MLAQEETSAVVIKSTLSLNDKSQWRQERYNRIRQLYAQIARLTKQLKINEEKKRLAPPPRREKLEKPTATKLGPSKIDAIRAKRRKKLATRLRKLTATKATSSSSTVPPTRASKRIVGRKKIDYSSLILSEDEDMMDEDSDLELAIRLQEEEQMKSDYVFVSDSDEDLKKPKIGDAKPAIDVCQQ